MKIQLITTRIVLREQLDEVLDTLTDREENVLRLRFGLDDGKNAYAGRCWKVFSVTRERIRQIEQSPTQIGASSNVSNPS